MSPFNRRNGNGLQPLAVFPCTERTALLVRNRNLLVLFHSKIKFLHYSLFYFTFTQIVFFMQLLVFYPAQCCRSQFDCPALTACERLLLLQSWFTTAALHPVSSFAQPGRHTQWPQPPPRALRHERIVATKQIKTQGQRAASPSERSHEPGHRLTTLTPLSGLVQRERARFPGSPIFPAQCQSAVRKVQLMGHNLCMRVTAAAASPSLLYPATATAGTQCLCHLLIAFFPPW